MLSVPYVATATDAGSTRAGPDTFCGRTQDDETFRTFDRPSTDQTDHDLSIYFR